MVRPRLSVSGPLGMHHVGREGTEPPPPHVGARFRIEGHGSFGAKKPVPRTRIADQFALDPGCIEQDVESTPLFGGDETIAAAGGDAKKKQPFAASAAQSATGGAGSANGMPPSTIQPP